MKNRNRAGCLGIPIVFAGGVAAGWGKASPKISIGFFMDEEKIAQVNEPS